MKITIQQIQFLLTFLNRVDIKGNEAEELVRLKMMLVQEGQSLQASEQQVEKVAKKVVEKVEKDKK